MTELTFIDAHNKLPDLALEYGLTAQQCWLMCCLLHSWNRSGRKPQWSQTTSELSERTNMTRQALGRARNRLEQSGLIAYSRGDRGKPPQYTLGVVWYHVTKCNINRTQPGLNPDINRTQPGLLTEKRREEEKNGGEFDIRDPLLPDQINSIRESWRNQPWTHVQRMDLLEVARAFEGYPFDLVQAYCAQADVQYLPKRSTFIADCGCNLRSQAEAWAQDQNPRKDNLSGAAAAWLPENWQEIASEVTGQDCHHMHRWQEIPADHKLAFEMRCREVSAA